MEDPIIETIRLADIYSPATCEREIRALTEAGRGFPDAARVLVSETDAPLGMAIPEAIEIVPVWRFLLSVLHGSDVRAR